MECWPVGRLRGVVRVVKHTLQRWKWRGGVLPLRIHTRVVIEELRDKSPEGGVIYMMQALFPLPGHHHTIVKLAFFFPLFKRILLPLFCPGVLRWYPRESSTTCMTGIIINTYTAIFYRRLYIYHTRVLISVVPSPPV